MAQFDLYRNPNAAQREGFPYLVVLQSDQLDHLSTRFAMPLQRLAQHPSTAPRRLAQTVVIDGEALYLAAQYCAALPARVLRSPVLSLAHESATLLDALDAVISGV